MKWLKKKRRIYIDTNVFIGYFSEREDDVKVLRYLFSLRNYELYTSTLALSQIISTLQKRHRDLEYRKRIIDFIYKIRQKMQTIIPLNNADIDTALQMDNVDIEDNIHFVLGSKYKCFFYITNNTKDFNYSNVYVLKPKYTIRVIKD